jgi:hypothetical protein
VSPDEYRELAANLRETARYWNSLALKGDGSASSRARGYEQAALQCLQEAERLEHNVNQA